MFISYSCATPNKNNNSCHDHDSCEFIQNDDTLSSRLNSASVEIDTALFYTQFDKWKKFHHIIKSNNVDSLDDVEWRGALIAKKADSDSTIDSFRFEESVYGKIQTSFRQDIVPKQDMATFIIALDLFSNNEFEIGLFSFEIYDKNSSAFQKYLINLCNLLSDEEKLQFVYNFTGNSLYSWVDKNYNKLQKQGINPEEYWQADYTNIWPEFTKFNPELVEWYRSNGFTVDDLSSGRFKQPASIFEPNQMAQ